MNGHENNFRTRQNLHGRPLAVIVLAVFLGIPQAVFSQNRQDKQLPLTIEVDTSSSINRTGGPIPLLVHLHYFGQQVGLAGHLRFNFRAQDGTLAATYEFPDLFITPGEQSFEFLIQPPTSGTWNDAYDVYPIFIRDDGQRFVFAEQLLRTPGTTRRACVVTIATLRDQELKPRDKEVFGQLSLEQYFPDLEATRPQNLPVRTSARVTALQDFPNHPLAHCVSDLVLLTGETFSRLSERQGQALLAWVRAGGSVAIFLDESERMSSEHLALLNRFTGANAETVLVTQLSNGTLQLGESAEEVLLLGNCGLGCAVIGRDSKLTAGSDRYTPEEFLQMYVHLWKIRDEQKPHLLFNPNPQWSLEPSRRYSQLNNQNYYDYTTNRYYSSQNEREFRAIPTAGGSGLLEATMPTGMEMLPLWMMGLTLFLYILAIGPGDYLLLGQLQMRKYTWVSFPVITVLFTAGAILAANYKMGGNDDGGTVVFRDITEDGLIARENELVTIIPASNATLPIPAQQELITPVDPYRLGMAYNYAYRQQYERRSAPPLYRGRFPVEAQLVRQVYKWSPDMFRRLRIPLEPVRESSGFDWSRPIDPTDRNGWLELTGRIRKAFGEQTHAFLLRRNARDDSAHPQFAAGNEKLDRIVLCGDSSIFEDPHQQSQVRMVTATPYQSQYVDTYYENVSFLMKSSLRQEAGMYSIVSRLSPKCDDFLEDLPLLDSSDEHTWLLVIVVQDGNDWEVYRKIVRTDSDPSASKSH